MGGDEVPGGVWVGSPAVQAFMQALGLTNVDDLWFAFYGRVEQILKAQGLAPSGWEEIAVRKTQRDGRRTTIPNPDFAARGWRAYVWNNVPGWGAEDLAYRLANGGYDVVLSPVTNLYFDLAWNPNPAETGLDWGGYVDLRKPFDLIPFDEYRNARFVNVIGQRELPRLDREVPALNYRIPTPGLKAEGGMVRCSLEVPGFTLRYTTDGNEPTARSAEVRGPIPMRGTVRVAAFTATG